MSTTPSDGSAVWRACDLLVIGGGAAGLAAARTGVALGARTILVQDGPVGGDCTFSGCVPSKALLAAAAAGETFPLAAARVRGAIARIAATEDDATLAAEGIRVVHGRARLRGGGVVDVEDQRIHARRTVLATGSSPAVPPVPGIDGVEPLTTDDVFSLEELPRSLAVMGGGPAGCELAQAFARLGAQVTLIERLGRLLPAEEPEVAPVVEDALSADGVTVLTGARVCEVARGPDGVVLRVADRDAPVTAERLLVVAGRTPMTDGLGVEAAGAARDARGFVVTDARMRTTAPGVYAAGDVTGRMLLTHAADEMGRVAARNALARRSRARFDERAIPRVVYTDPEVASVGCREADAPDDGWRVAELPMEEVDRAVIEGRTAGFVKLIAAPRRTTRSLGGGRLVGATVVAPRAGEMIHEAALAIRTGMFAGRLAQTVHAYPAWSLGMRMAAGQLVTRVGGRTARAARPKGGHGRRAAEM